MMGENPMTEDSDMKKDGDEPIIFITDEIDATEYSIGLSRTDNEMILKFHNKIGVLSVFVTDSQGAYDLAQRLLGAYDKLEGL
jgi:hypothetical protein